MPQIIPPPADDCTLLTPFRVGCDWLTLSMSGPRSLFDLNDATYWQGVGWWRRTEHTTEVMQRVFYLEDHDGNKLLTASAWPWSAAIGPADWVMVQFANPTLYTQPHWITLYHALRKMGFRYWAVTRLDIAADMLEDSGGDVMAPIRKAWTGEARYYGRAKWTPTMAGKDRIESVTLGTRRSNKYFRVYDKTRELKTPGSAHKAAYITAAWAASLGGFNPMTEQATVNRFEVQLRGKEIRRYFPEEAHTESAADSWVESLADRQRLVSMFGSMAVNTYDFRTHADRARDARTLVQWDLTKAADGFEVRPRAPRAEGISDRAIKGMLKNTWRVAYLTGDTYWQAKAMEVAGRAGLLRWMDRWIPAWEKEVQHLREQGDINTRRLDTDPETNSTE